MKKMIGILTAVSLMLTAQPVLAKDNETLINKGLTEVVAPSTPTLINGIPEQNTFSTFAVPGEMFHSYSPNTPSRVEKFREIIRYTHDNSLSSQSFPMSATIQTSESQGSEFHGEVSFEAGIKAGILGKVTTQVSGGVKETRSTNEAVGVSGGPLNVPAYKKGEIVFYYAGISTAGTLTTKVYHSSLGGYIYYTYPINAKIHKKVLDVHSTARTY